MDCEIPPQLHVMNNCKMIPMPVIENREHTVLVAGELVVEGPDADVYGGRPNCEEFLPARFSRTHLHLDDTARAHGQVFAVVVLE